MINNVLEELTKELSTRFEIGSIDAKKQSLLIGLAKDKVMNALQTHAMIFSAQSLRDLFKSVEPFEKNQMVQRVMLDYKSALVTQVALNDRQADTVSKFVVPFMLLLISNKVNTHASALDTLLSENGEKGMFDRFKFWNTLSPSRIR